MGVRAPPRNYSAGDVGKHAIVIRPRRVDRGHHHSRVLGAERVEVDDYHAAVPLTLRETDASPQRWIELHRVDAHLCADPKSLCASGVQHDLSTSSRYATQNARNALGRSAAAWLPHAGRQNRALIG